MTKLNLGCSDKHIADYINVDRVHPADVVTDLSERWPWEDSSVTEIIAHDIIEHLPDKIHTMNEAYRVLQHGGLFRVIVPTTDGPGAFQDPTHVSFWHRNSMWYYTHGDPHRERFGKAYGIEARFIVKREHIVRGISGIVHLEIDLETVK
jgi:predicted SAM-dependent methyltransferase